MTDQWYYRVFGEDFGPVPFEKLREMAAKGTVGADDEVRRDNSNHWVAARSVEGLGLGSIGGGTAVATATVSDTTSEGSSSQSGLDEWYCLLHGNELGPLSFDELLKYAEHDNLSADDQVKLGANGKWRRVGSIGRLVAVLPYRPVESKTPAPANRTNKSKTPASEQRVIEGSGKAAPSPMSSAEAAPQVDMQAAYQAAYEQAKAQIASSMMAQAEAAFKASEEAAKSEIAWAFAPNVDPQWWGFMGGAEFGPVGFQQVFALAKNGQLKPSDFIRNGPTGQFFASSNAPGLYKAVAMVIKAAETLELAKVQAQAAASLAAPPPVAPSLVAPPQLPTKPALAEATSLDDLVVAAPSVTTSKPVSNASESPAAQPARRNSNPSMTTTAEVTSAKANTPPREIPTPREPVASDSGSRPAPPPPSMNSGYSSSSMSSSSSYSTASRMPVAPPRPATRPSASRQSSVSLSESLGFLKEPKSLGVVGTIAVVLLFVGWGYLPKSSAEDRRHFNELKQIYDEIKVKRSANSNDFAPVVKKAEEVRKTVTADLAKKASRDYPVKQFLLWAARDQLPGVIAELQKTPSVPGKAEEVFVARLRDAADRLGIKDAGFPPPPAVQADNAIDAN